jgi:hypothetical protein
MSRNRYTAIVHKQERRQLRRQEKELVALTRSLRRSRPELTVTPPVIDEVKQRRRARLERKQKNKPTLGASADQPQAA